MSSLILHNFRLLTPYHQKIEAIYIRNHRIVAMGTKEEIFLQWGRFNVEKIDLEGGYLTPGLVDSHLHLSLIGQKLVALDFSSIQSKEEFLEQLRKRVREVPKGKWIVGYGWNEVEFRGEIPTLEELDQVSPEHPILLTRICHHVHLANSHAARTARKNPDQEEPEEGSYGRDLSGRWNGLIYENASLPFLQAIPEPSKAEKKEIFRRAMKQALQFGLTAVHTEDMRLVQDAELLVELMHELHKEGIWLRTHHLIYHPFMEQVQDQQWRESVETEFFRLGAIKAFADGSFGGRTAWLKEPYLDQPTTGLPIHTDEELLQIAERARNIGLPIAVHAIGDRAAEQVIQTMKQVPLSKEVCGRHRLIHASLLSPELVDEVATMPIVLDLQPLFAQSDHPMIKERIGEERREYAYLWKTLLRRGIKCAAGTDAPIEAIDPLQTIKAAQNRLDWEEKRRSPEALTIEEILSLYTTGSAYAAGEEQERGKIEIGYFADFTVWDRSLKEDIDSVKVTHTICNGNVAYQANN